MIYLIDHYEMTLDQLQVLVTIVEKGSFRSASETLNRAQSAVSYAIRALESEIGQPLFDRQSYRPTLTPAGRMVLAQARQVLHEESRLKGLAEILRQGVEPHLKVAVAAIYPMARLTDSLCAFREQFPHTQLTLISDVLGADRRLLTDEVELAICEPLGVSPEIENEPLDEVIMWPVMAQGQKPLPGRKAVRSVHAAEIEEIPQIVVMSSTGGEDRSAGVVREGNAWRVSDFATKLELIQSGLGWGRMPVDWIEASVKSGQLLRLNDDTLYRVKINLARRRGKVRGPAFEFLWGALSSGKVK